jgi:hypothetical protein
MNIIGNEIVGHGQAIYAKWIGLWFVQKAFVVLNMHCSDGLFDQMWSSCEPYILCFFEIEILFYWLSWIQINVLFFILFFRTSILKSPKTTIGQLVGDFDISSWSVDEKIVKDKDGGL